MEVGGEHDKKDCFISSISRSWFVCKRNIGKDRDKRLAC